MPSKAEIKRIIDLYNDGLSQGQIAQEMGKGKTTIHQWLHELFDSGELKERTDSERSQTKNATATKKNYDKAARLELNNKFLDKIEKLLETSESINDLKGLSVSYGIMIDKRALLDGDATQNVSISNKSIDERLSELANRRSERKASTDP